MTHATESSSDISKASIIPIDSVPPPRPRLHLDYLDGIRALAALFVAFYHCYLAVYIHTGANGVSRWISAPMLFGHLAVPIFIVISGFCLMLPVVRDNGILRGGALFFFRKRGWRIIPTYYCALLIFLAAHHMEKHHVPSSKDVLTHIFLVHNLWPDTFRGSINPSFWSIAVEWQIYFAFPLLVYSWRTYGGVATLLATLTVSIAAFFALTGTPLAGLTTHFYGLFAIGMFGSCVAFSTDSRWQSFRFGVPWGWLGAVLSLVGIVVSQFWGAGTAIAYQVCVLHLIAGLVAMCVLVAASKSRVTLLTRALSWKPIVFLGTFSYSIYLLHQPCLHLVLRLFQRFGFGDDPLYLLLTFVGVPMVVTVAYLFYLGCERPFVQAKARVQKSDNNYAA